MRKAALLQETQRQKILENSGVNVLRGANLISVDIQPEYQDYLDFDLYSYLQYLNDNIENLNSLTFLYNGADTLGMVSENDFKMWLVENGFEEDNLNYSRFYDKGYAFFRYCMDEGLEEDDIVALVQFMISNDINDSRDMDAEMWESFVLSSDVDRQEIRDLMEVSDDMINIPDLMDFLKNYGGRIVLTGGGINECLKEVEIALLALHKPYNVLTQWTY
jgi:hypothetical protein